MSRLDDGNRTRDLRDDDRSRRSRDRRDSPPRRHSRSRSPAYRSYRSSDGRYDREDERDSLIDRHNDDSGQRQREKPARKRDRGHSSRDDPWKQVGKERWGNADEEEKIDKLRNPAVPAEEKVKANFGLTGALAKDVETGNMRKGQVLKFSEPLDAAQPTKQWRFYVFKGDEVIETLYIHRQSVYLVGRDDRIADIVTLHESCSKQHAVIQFREIERLDSRKSSDEGKNEVKPYLMDLGSANKTFLNGKEIEEARYYELKEKDIIRFGASSREYVLLHSSSAS